MNKPVFRRLLAYLLDLLIVIIISSAIASLPVFKKQYNEYEKLTNDYLDVLAEASNDPAKATELLNNDAILEMSYKISKKGLFINVINVVITALYFIGFQYYTGGKTGGKALFKIEVVPTDGKKLKFRHILIRSLVVNNIVITTVSLLLLALCTQKVYMNVSQYVELVQMGILFLSAGMILYTADGYGLHDKLAHTRVILSEEKEYYMTKKVKDAKVIKEKVEN